ncbi:hypothetical protein TUM4641_01610 [Shewanella morhuae]|nr:hypothetical protein TUM4641_01610 [Shewanella morhuae]
MIATKNVRSAAQFHLALKNLSSFNHSDLALVDHCRTNHYDFYRITNVNVSTHVSRLP